MAKIPHLRGGLSIRYLAVVAMNGARCAQILLWGPKRPSEADSSVKRPIDSHDAAHRALGGQLLVEDPYPRYTHRLPADLVGVVQYPGEVGRD